MGYVESNLMSDERVLHWGRLHWILFVGPGILLLIGLVMLPTSPGGGENTSSVNPIGILVVIIAAIWLLKAFLTYISTELAITNKRVIAKFGFIRRNTTELNHNKVESLNVDQGIIGRILDFGTVKIHGTGAGMSPVPKVEDPLSFRRAQNEAVEGAK
jgi:uncharacterized membrane protein YdbT with pleckstrin-like domain